MNITLDDIEEIQRDDRTLKQLIVTIETGYSWLAAECNYAMGGHTGENEDVDIDDEEEDEETRDMKSVNRIAKGLMVVDQPLAVTDYDGVDTSFPGIEDEFTGDDDSISFDGVESKKSEEKEDEIPIKTLYRMIKQASHPDKIMRFSAEQKKQILECFHESTEHMEDENMEALVFCFVRVFLIRGEPKRITYWLWKFVSERHNQIKHHMRYLNARPYMPAIKAWKRGDKELAIRCFKYYLSTIHPDNDDSDCFDD
jgi:hypothetical protein